MLEIIALIFLARKIGELASEKGQPTGKWKLFLVLAWIGFEILGVIVGVMLFGTDNLIGLGLFAIVCAFGGYLVVRSILLKMPDDFNNEIDNIGHT